MAAALAGLETLLGYALNGVVLAGIIALAAVGLTLVYGILRLSNFAHGDLLTVGAYLVFAFNAFYAARAGPLAAAWTAIALLAAVAWARHRLHRGEQVAAVAVAGLLFLLAFVPDAAAGLLGPRFLLGVVLSIVWMAILLLFLDRLVWAPLRRRRASIVTLIITSIGLALLLRNVIALVFGTSLRSYARPIQPPMEIAGLRITAVQSWTLIVAVLVVAAVHFLLQHTRLGRCLRAVADDQDLARVAGIDVERMIAYVWILAGALAALAGVLLALNINVNTNLGWRLLLPIFAAVILGGIGNVYGAMLGALVIAVAMEVSVLWLPNSGYRLAVGFGILILTMLVRPQGILGVKR